MSTDHDIDIEDIGHDLEISNVRPNPTGGQWIHGTLAGHAFEALVFSCHAPNPAIELGDSRIAKLWIARLADGVVTYRFDRGEDCPAADGITRVIVDFLAAGLADHVFGS